MKKHFKDSKGSPEPNLEGKIYEVLKENKERWQPLDVLAAKSGLKSGDVIKIINQSDRFVLSSNNENEPVITTRERFRKEEPFLKKLIGAFKNRID